MVNEDYMTYNDYGTTGTPDDSLNRLSEIDDSATAQPLASYQYLGLNTIVTEKYQEPEIELDYTGGTDAYTGLDQFGRAIDQVWKNYSTGGSPLDEFKYGYNSAGDVQWKQNVAADDAGQLFDESYTYNDLGELTGAQRGQLTSDGKGGEVVNGGTPIYSASLDGLGPTSDGPLPGNDANQTAGCSYDNAGNLTFDGTNTYTYNAWNRLVQVSDSSTTVNYGYDGDRPAWSSESPSNTTDYYFYAGSQVVETREKHPTGQRRVGAGPVPVRLVGPERRPDLPRHDHMPAGQPTATDRIYYLTDANDNVTAITNNAGRCRSDTCIRPSAKSRTTTALAAVGSWSTASANHNTILFAGQNLDPTTGLNYDHAALVQSGPTERHVPYARPDGLRRRRPEPLPLLRQQPDLRNRPDRAGSRRPPECGKRDWARNGGTTTGFTSPGTASRFSCPTARLFRARKATTGPPSASPWATPAPDHLVGSAYRRLNRAAGRLAGQRGGVREGRRTRPWLGSGRACSSAVASS